MDGIAQLFGEMEAQETRLFGEAHCIVPKEEVEIDTIVVESAGSSSQQSHPGKKCPTANMHNIHES